MCIMTATARIPVPVLSMLAGESPESHWALGHLGIDPVDWLGDPRWAMPTIILFAVWKNFGYNMVIFLAGLQAIPRDLYEAARIDGASRWQQFLHVTLPSLRPTILFTVVVSTIGAPLSSAWTVASFAAEVAGCSCAATSPRFETYSVVR